jgi:hypothetical protein
MTTHILVTEDGSIWPYDLGQLRRDNPNVSFSNYPSEEDLEPFNCRAVSPTEAPTYDQRTQYLEQAFPELIDGTWRQTWRIMSRTAEEVAAYDEANLPIPDWQGAFQALVKELLPPDRFQDVASQFNLPIDPQ